ncbi:MAG TPA: glycerophosphodiester phosphodiesterase family protein [Myxococcales bacterium]|nr:glycerophosphodiester phosphodiesterase family protein [Myxococcales bacterium]
MLPAGFSIAGRPLVWGHRGASSDAPENTLAAFELARAQGADGVELDAQRCGSGEVVVLHDESLGRTTGFAGLIAETPYAVVRKLDAGSRKAERFRGERVPLLAEVLEAFPRLVNVELKCEQADDRGLTTEVVRIVREAGAAERVLLSSFNPLCLLRARMLAPRIPRALLFEQEQQWWLRSGLSAPALQAAAMHPEHVLATPERVRRWLARGYSVGCWTVDDPDTAARLWESGVTGIITNRPAAMRARWG